MKKLLLLIFLIVPFAFNAIAQTTLTLQPDSATGNSASINSIYPDAPFLYPYELDALAWTIGGTPCVMRGLVGFDLSSIPAGATIQSATLTLYDDINASNGDNGMQISLTSSNAAWVQRITSPWNESTVTWNTQPSTTTLNEAILPADTTPYENYIVDVSTIVQDMINNPSTSFGFLVRLQVEQYYAALVFGTSSNPDSTIHPKLVITYTTGCTSLVLQPDSATGNSASINSIYPDSPFLYPYELDALAWTIGGDPDIIRGLVSFDLSSIPAGATIQSSTLTLYDDINASNGDNGMQISLTSSNAAWVQRITSPWNERTLTWNSQPATTTLDEAILPADTTPYENYVVDVTTLVQDMINNPSTSFGFLVRLQVEQYYAALVFGTSGNPDAAIHPKLEICYTAVVVAPPVALFQSVDSTICTNSCISFTDQSSNATSWKWSFPGAHPDTSTNENPQNICYQTSGNYNVTLIASNTLGSDTLTLNNYITVSQPPSISLSSNSPLCDSTDLNLSANYVSGATYSWSGPSNFASAYQSPVVVSASTADSGWYYCTIDNNGCNKTDSILADITKNADATINAIGSTSFCLGGSVTLTANATPLAAAYSWNTGATTQSISVDTTGNYSCIVFSCQDNVHVSPIHIDVYSAPPTPVITEHHDTLYCSTNPSYISYQWYLDSTSIPTATDTFLVVSHNDNYNVEVTDINGCSIAVGINTAFGINEFFNNEYISLSPNPATNQLTLHPSLSSNEQKTIVSIMNVLGQEVIPPIALLMKGEDAVIDISKLPSGMYFLQLKTESSNGIAVKRFVKE